MTALNAALAYRVLDHIEAHPETWDQENWCGTAQCFAGWAVALSGETPDDWQNVLVDGQLVFVADRAAELLGFRNRDEMDNLADQLQWEAGEVDDDDITLLPSLFAGGNTRRGLEYLVRLMFGPRPAAGGAA